MSLVPIIERVRRQIQSNPVFKFFSSVQLAIFLMSTLLLASAYGTVVESRYNADIATIEVYRSSWFIAVLGLLWVNIFCATVARIPFKKHHTGFVITHIGLLTLLVGGILTALYGVDGQLRVIEERSDDEVFLPGLTLRTQRPNLPPRSVRLSRLLRPASGSELKELNTVLDSGIYVDRYLPFVSTERGFSAQEGGQGTAIRFSLKSQFFDVTEWLHSDNQPELRMGPALLKLDVDGSFAPKKPAPGNPTKKSKNARSPSSEKKPPSGSARLIVSQADGKELSTLLISQLQKGPLFVGPVKVALGKIYQRAMVSGGKLVEGDQGDNPAIEFTLEHQGEKLREVAFARFEQFSLNNNGTFGLKFKYVAAGAPAPSAASEMTQDVSSPHSQEMPQDSVHAGLQQSQNSRGGAGDNVVVFRVNPADSEAPKTISVRLFKKGEVVLEKTVALGEVVQTPWMGMTIRVDDAIVGAGHNHEVRPIELPERSNLPPSAIHLRTPGDPTGVWLVEGESREFSSDTERLEIYYGQDSLRLPFRIKLLKFSKIDYPGTEMALSYQSEVQVNGEGPPITIMMNEPLKRDGYTLYQSSYVLEPGRPPMSIFSVNWDPGRAIKYAGSLLLCIGIVVFTVMRSGWYLARQSPRRRTA